VTVTPNLNRFAAAPVKGGNRGAQFLWIEAGWQSCRSAEFARDDRQMSPLDNPWPILWFV